MSYLGRTLIPKPNSTHLLSSIVSLSFFVKSNSVPRFIHSYSSSSSFLYRVSRSLSSLTNTSSDVSRFPSMVGLRGCSSTSSWNDPSPNWNNRPPKETIFLDGCDYEHWLIVVEKPDGEPTRDEIIDSYIKTLAQVVGSEEEARMKIYSVSTRNHFAFGALVSEELSYKLKELPRVRWVLPDSYLDVRNKDYGGEPFINGQAVPYEEWVRNNARAQDRSRRNDQPHNFVWLRNFERWRKNMQNRDAQPPMQNSGANMGGPPGPNMQHPGPSMQHPDPNMGSPPNANMQHHGPNMGGPPGPDMQHPGPSMQNPGLNMGVPPNAYLQHNGPNMGVTPNPNMQHPGPNMGAQPMQSNIGVPLNANMQNSVPNYAGQNAAYSNNVNMGNFGPPRDAGPTSGYTNMNAGVPPNRDAGPSVGYPNSVPRDREAPDNGGVPRQSRDGPGPMPNRDYQNSYTPSSNMGGVPSNTYQVSETEETCPRCQTRITIRRKWKCGNDVKFTEVGR